MVWQTRDDFSSLRRLKIGTLVVLVGLQGVYQFPIAFRQRIITEQHAGVSIDRVIWFRIFVLSTLLNNFVMQGGLVYRQRALKREAGVGLTAYIGSYATAGWLTLLFQLGLAALFLGWLSPEVDIGPAPAWLVMVVAWVSVIGVPFALRPIARATGSTNRVVLAAAEIVETATDLHRRPTFVRQVAWSSATSSLLGGLVVILGGRAVHTEVGWGEAMLFVALVQIASLAAVTPGNVGLRELAFGIVGSSLESGAAGGLLISTVTRATGLISLVIAYGGAWVVEWLRRRDRTALPSS
jgi:hypothetical protein